MKASTKTLELALIAAIIGIAVVGIGVKYRKHMKGVLQGTRTSFSTGGW